MSVRLSHDYRKIWSDANGPIPCDENGRSYEIHHINGNHNDNRLENLQLVTIEQHYDIHYSQGDYYACKLMSFRMQMTPEEISQKQSILSKNMWKSEAYRENFLKKMKEYSKTPKGVSALSKAGKKGYANQPQEAKLERAKKGGRAAVEKGHFKRAQEKSVRRVMSVDDGKITCWSWVSRYEKKTGYAHTWIDL